MDSYIYLNQKTIKETYKEVLKKWGIDYHKSYYITLSPVKQAWVLIYPNRNVIVSFDSGIDAALFVFSIICRGFENNEYARMKNQFYRTLLRKSTVL